MDKKFVPYINYGKRVRSSYTGEDYVVVDKETRKPEKATLLCVAVSNWSRYKLLNAWIMNKVGSMEEHRKEMGRYEVKLRVASITPIDEIRFLNEMYETMFKVQNLQNVLVNGITKRVYYIDEYHFGFVDGGAYHISEFMERCNRDGVKVQSISLSTCCD